MSKIKKIMIVFTISIILIVVGVLIFNIIHNNTNMQLSAEKVAKINENVDIIPMADINEEDVQMKTGGEAMYSTSISNYTKNANEAEFIIIGTVESLDGVVIYNPVYKEYVMPRTVGTVKVNRVIKGNLEYSEIPFMKLGATLSLFEYEKVLFPAEVTKMGLDKLSDDEKKNTYVTDMLSDDIQIKAGKTYLMYVNYYEDYGVYSIQYFKYGLREVESDRISEIVGENAKKLDIDELKSIRVKDNTNGEYETLETVIPSNIWNNMK
ncbi:MAG: hypothetical protein IJ223_01985 [Clostridia bacterium]|nr:hypothetical protein [Clostridia bacterium]